MRQVNEKIDYLRKRFGRVNQKNYTYLYEYMQCYYYMLHIVRRYSDLEIIFLVQQHSAKQTMLSIIDHDNPQDAYAIYINEDDEDSLNDLISTTNQMGENYRNLQSAAAQDDQMNIIPDTQ